jgi:hypothetical protein
LAYLSIKNEILTIIWQGIPVKKHSFLMGHVGHDDFNLIRNPPVSSGGKESLWEKWRRLLSRGQIY